MERGVRSLAAVTGALRPLRTATIVGLSVFGLLAFAACMLWQPAQPDFHSVVGFDAFAYWHVDPMHPYQAPLGTFSSFTYSPAFALVSSQAHVIPFWLFYVLWDSFLILLFVWLTRRMAWVWLAFLPVPMELYHGNVHILLAAVCVLGFEYPALWSIGLLTKVTPGISLLWFAVRREWRSLGLALGATAAISAVSFAIAPSAWFDWVRFLIDSNSSGPQVNGTWQYLLPPLWLRLAVAAVLVVWGARTDRRWVVPVAVAASMPVIWPITPTLLLAIPRLRSRALPRASRPDAECLSAQPLAAAGSVS